MILLRQVQRLLSTGESLMKSLTSDDGLLIAAVEYYKYTSPFLALAPFSAFTDNVTPKDPPSTGPLEPRQASWLLLMKV
ncbi:hypothetical protein DSO57_1015203 [Entomophthora muscae]|uniref:Uncharacterized protein n=1 Tax=Entomophthora muscae TaxID=34485 RepID=A0ACC2S798_9FUNG|nr:hypothetical protein DSO57_1015203 [Entomophthora muscae]